MPHDTSPSIDVVVLNPPTCRSSFHSSVPTDSATAADVQELAGRNTMFHKAVLEVIQATGLGPRVAETVVRSVLRAWETPSHAVKTCPRECTELFEDENQVVRGAATDFGKSWSQQVAHIVKEGARNGP